MTTKLKEYEEMKPDGLLDWQKQNYLKAYRRFYANAYVTHCECGGHNKAHHNELAMKQWKEKIKEFDGEVPDREEALRWGDFNGEGSY